MGGYEPLGCGDVPINRINNSYTADTELFLLLALFVYKKNVYLTHISKSYQYPTTFPIGIKLVPKTII